MFARSRRHSSAIVMLLVVLLLAESFAALPTRTRAAEPSPTPVAPSPAPTQASPETASPSPSSSPVASPEPSSPAKAQPDPSELAVAPRAEEPVVLPDPTDEERVELRTESSRTFDVGGGQLTTEFATEQIHYRPEGSEAYEPIDLAFRSAAGETLVVDRSPVTVRVAAADDPAGILTVSDDDFSISYAPAAEGPGGSSAPQTSNVAPGSRVVDV